MPRNCRIHDKVNTFLSTSKNQKLRSAGDSGRRSNRFCSISVLRVGFMWQMIKTRVIRLRGAEGRNALVQIAFCVFHSFLVEVQTNVATYMRRMRNNNLKIEITGSSCLPQLAFQLKNFHKYKPLNNFNVT